RRSERADPRRLVSRRLPPALDVGVDPAQGVLGHRPILCGRQLLHEGDEVLKAGLSTVRAERLKTHHRLLRIEEEPARETVQEVEIGANVLWEPLARRDEPGIE